jgi:hypothetical protein
VNVREDEILFRLPEWSIAIALLVVLLAVVALARRYGRHDHDRFGATEDDAASVSGASLGLLALLLAFTYSVASSHYDLRKQLVLKEANAIGTAFLRADLSPAPQRAELRELLRSYADLRVGFSESGLDPMRRAEMLRESDRLHTAIWAVAERSIEGRAPTPLDAILFQSLIVVIDVHAERLRADRDHVPEIVIFLLIAVAIASVTMLGYAAGRKGDRRQWLRALLPVLIVGVITLILDLDRPCRGLIRVSQQPLLDLRESLRASPDLTPRAPR